MTSFDLLEAIGEVDEGLIEELNQTSPEGEKRIPGFHRKYFSSSRRRFAAAALIACAGFALCMGVRFYQNFLDSQHYTHKCGVSEMAESQLAEEQAKSNSKSIQRDVIDDSSKAEENENFAGDNSYAEGNKNITGDSGDGSNDTMKSENTESEENPVSKGKAAILGEVQLNQIDSLYGNTKFGGNIKKVSEGQWQEQYGKAEFLEGHALHEKKYYLSYSEQNEVLYGVCYLEMGDDIAEMGVSDGKMFDSPFEEMKKTKIGKYEIAICQCQSGESSGYAAIIPGGDAFYTIEQWDWTLEEFEELIEEVFDYR